MLLSQFILADVMPKVLADVIANNLFICGRWRATMVDVATI